MINYLEGLEPIKSPDEIEVVDTSKFLYCYRDNLIGVYGDPIVAPEEPKKFLQVIKGAAQHGQLKPEMLLSNDLYFLGVFHTKDANLELLEKPVELCKLSIFCPDA